MKNDGKIHHFEWVKSTISMAMFNSYFDITRGYPGSSKFQDMAIRDAHSSMMPTNLGARQEGPKCSEGADWGMSCLVVSTHPKQRVILTYLN